MKYKLTDETTEYEGSTLHRIRALRSFGNVSRGDLGGFVESEHNLSQSGTCWVYNDAIVKDKAVVEGNATVSDNAVVRDWARISDKAGIGRFATIQDSAKVYGWAAVTDNVVISRQAEVCGVARINRDVLISDQSKVYGNAKVSGFTRILGASKVFGAAEIHGASEIYGGCIQSSIDVLQVSGPYGTVTAYRGIRDGEPVSWVRYQGKTLRLEDFIAGNPEFAKLSLGNFR